MRADICEKLSAGLGLSAPTEAAIIARLWRARPGYVPAAELNASTAQWSRLFDHATRRVRSPETVKVLVCYIRRKLGRDFVLNSHGDGYALSPDAVAICRKVLQ